jgi:type III pantothenate kinase
MLLAIDIGNTNIKTALFDGNNLVNLNIHQSVDDCKYFINRSSFNAAAISSVVPRTTETINNFLIDSIHLHPFIISKDSNLHFSLYYKTISTLGIDRICAVEGALYHVKNQNRNFDYIVTVDFGTATTINILEMPDKFLGGVIAPGIETMFKSLSAGTAQLPKIETINYEDIIGTDTSSCIASGVLNSTIGLLDRVINNLKKKKDGKFSLFITGGNAHKVQNLIDYNFTFEPALVLWGVKSLSELNAKD